MIWWHNGEQSMEENSVGLLLNILQQFEETSLTSFKAIIDEKSNIGSCNILRDMPKFVKPVFRDSRMLEKVVLPAIKDSLSFTTRSLPFCLLSALRHIDTGAHLYSSWFYRVCFSNKNKRNAFEYNLKGFYALFYLLILIFHSGIGEGMGVRVFLEMRLSVQKFRMRDSKPWSKDQL